MKLLSIVVPVYNEAGNITRLHAAFKEIAQELPEYSFEYIFVDDGSTDTSVLQLEELAERDSSVKVVVFSRNFGKEAAVSAGIHGASGAAIIILDADLQHPPDAIPSFVHAWESGGEVVIGIRRPRKGEGFMRKVGSRMFASVMKSISTVKAPSGATDFRLIDRTVADAFSSLTEHHRLTRSLIDWLGFKRVYLSFDANERTDGVQGYSFRKLLGVAVSALTAHSRVPLSIGGYLGVSITLLASALGFFVLIEQLVLGDPLGIEVSGTAMLAILILFLNGIILISFGLMSLYIGTIHEDAANRPLYVVRTRIGIK